MQILVDRRELEKKLTQAGKGKLIEFCIVPPQFDRGKLNPALLHIGTVHKDGSYEDLESICECRKLRLVKPVRS